MTSKCAGDGTPFEIAQEAIIRLMISVLRTSTAIKPGDLFVIGCHGDAHKANCALLSARSIMTRAGAPTSVEDCGGREKALGFPEFCGTCGKRFFTSTKLLVFQSVP